MTRGRQGNASSEQALSYEDMVVPMALAGLNYTTSTSSLSVSDMFHFSPKAKKTLKDVKVLIDEKVIPAEEVCASQLVFHYTHNIALVIVY